MAKPSIFSRDYERRMKKRKRRVTAIIIILVVVILGSFYKFKIAKADLSELKAKIQAWVDSGKPEEEKEEVNYNDNEEENKEKIPEKVPEKTYVDLIVSEGIIIKAEYTEENNVKKYIAIEDNKGLEYSISPNGTQILITDKAQDLKLYDINGNVTDVTKQSYISGAGDTFLKADILAANPTYIWHSQARFLDETKIIYVSQLPYFGNAAVNKYIWIYDLQNKTETPLYSNAAPEITLGNPILDKGMSLTINGANYIVGFDGTITTN